MKWTRKVEVALAVPWLLFAGAPLCLGGERDWPITTLDSKGNVGQYADLQVDSEGHLHIVYLRTDTGTLKMISQGVAGWGSPAEIDNSGSVAGHCAVAPAPGGQLPTSYQRNDTYALWHAGPQEPQVWSADAITADPEIEKPYWAISSVEQDGDVGRQISMVKGLGGRLGYTHLGYDTFSQWHVGAGEIIPDSLPIQTVVEDSVATGGGDHVYPDLFFAPGEAWALSFRNAVDGHLYFASTDSVHVPQAVSDPVAGGGAAPALAPRLLGAVPNPTSERLHVRYAADREAPVLLQVFDIAGRLVRTHESRSHRGTNSIDCVVGSGTGTELAAGVYFLELHVGSTRLGPQRFLLIR